MNKAQKILFLLICIISSAGFCFFLFPNYFWLMNIDSDFHQLLSQALFNKQLALVGDISCSVDKIFIQDTLYLKHHPGVGIMYFCADLIGQVFFAKPVPKMLIFAFSIIIHTIFFSSLLFGILHKKFGLYACLLLNFTFLLSFPLFPTLQAPEGWMLACWYGYLFFLLSVYFLHQFNTNPGQRWALLFAMFFLTLALWTRFTYLIWAIAIGAFFIIKRTRPITIAIFLVILIFFISNLYYVFHITGTLFWPLHTLVGLEGWHDSLAMHLAQTNIPSLPTRSTIEILTDILNGLWGIFIYHNAIVPSSFWSEYLIRPGEELYAYQQYYFRPIPLVWLLAIIWTRKNDLVKQNSWMIWGGLGFITLYSTMGFSYIPLRYWLDFYPWIYVLMIISLLLITQTIPYLFKFIFYLSVGSILLAPQIYFTHQYRKIEWSETPYNFIDKPYDGKNCQKQKISSSFSCIEQINYQNTDSIINNLDNGDFHQGFIIDAEGCKMLPWAYLSIKLGNCIGKPTTYILKFFEKINCSDWIVWDVLSSTRPMTKRSNDTTCAFFDQHGIMNTWYFLNGNKYQKPQNIQNDQPALFWSNVQSAVKFDSLSIDCSNTENIIR